MSGPASRLTLALREEIGKLDEFIGLLESEQALLKAGQTEALIPLIDKKNALATALGELAQTREAALSGMNLPDGRSGMEIWLATTEGQACRAEWSRLLDLTRKARDLNETNGKLIGLHLSHNQQAFAALMGAADRAMTYGPDGQQQTGLGGRILGKA